MNERNEFWERPVNDTLWVELIPGDQPSLLIEREDDALLHVELSELRPLIEVLTVALGELYILKDRSTLTQVEQLLATDITLEANGTDQRPALILSRKANRGKVRELIRRYSEGVRSFPKADLRKANLVGADLREISLVGADLAGANLEEANLSQANLEEANLLQANLQGADLSKANLKCAKVTAEQLAEAKLLKGATMPDGTEHN
jgi:hypothetical protein